MADYNELLKIMRQAGAEATNAECPVIICFGKVVSKSPLKINVDQKMTLGAAQLVLTRNVTDYETNVTIEWETTKELSKHKHMVDGTETSEVDLKHSHDVKGKKKITIHNALVKGDEVILLRQQGGQKYIVVDKVV